MRAERFAPESDQRGFLLARPGWNRLAIADDVDERGLDTLPEPLGLVGIPFETLIHLTRNDEDRKLGEPAVETGVEPQILVDPARELIQVGAIQANPTRPLQPGERTRVPGRLVVHLLAGVVEIVALDERQAVARVGIHVLRKGRGVLRQRVSEAPCAEQPAHREQATKDVHGHELLHAALPSSILGKDGELRPDTCALGEMYLYADEPYPHDDRVADGVRDAGRNREHDSARGR